MILTNDGDLANRLAHPRYGVEKLYRALVAGLPDPEMLAKLTEGVWLSDGKVRAKRARIVGRQGQATMLELVLAEGKKREIRRMLSKLGHKVMSLNRIAVGPISLKGLSVGECRSLSRHEVELLRKVAVGRRRVAASVLRCATRQRRSHGESHRPRRPEQRPFRAKRTTTPRRAVRTRTARAHRGSVRVSRQRKTCLTPAPGGHDRSRPRARPPTPMHQSVARCQPASKTDRPSLRPNPDGQPSTPVESRRPAGSASLPPEPIKPRRRIIGLELDSAPRDRTECDGRAQPEAAAGPQAPTARARARDENGRRLRNGSPTTRMH